MSDLDLIREASLMAWRLRGETPPQLTDLLPEWDYSDEDIARLWLVADEWRLAVETMCKVIGDEWVKRWKDRGNRGVEIDGYLVTTKKGSKYTECNDVEGFWAAALADPDGIPNWFNPNTVRVGQIPQAVRDTFFDEGTRVKPHHERKPSAIPVEKLNKEG